MITGRRRPATRTGESCLAVCEHCDAEPQKNGGVGTDAINVRRWASRHAHAARHRVMLKTTQTTYYNGHIRKQA